MTNNQMSQLRRPPLLAERIAETLFSEIRSGKYKRGEKLPTERELSELYGVSRPVVREAMGHLRQDNIIVSRQGSGAFVAEVPTSVFRLKSHDTLEAADVRNIVELLIAVEATASGYAAERRSERQLQVIRETVDNMQEAIESGGSGVEEDIAFHRAIVEATGNPVFLDMLDFLDGRVRSFIRTARQNSARVEGLLQQVGDEHAAILHAIENKDREGARKAATDHLNNALARLSLYKPGWDDVLEVAES
tara:strand:+ start:11798 stop:12544 length:747 start_codon:yes stop_codon:yes gene_type:complete